MAREHVEKSVDSWFDATTREGEHAWIERMEDVLPMFQEMGYSRGEGAMLFMMNHLLMQVSKVHGLLIDIEEHLDTGSTPT